MLSARSRLGERTFGGPRDNGEDAPKAVTRPMQGGGSIRPSRSESAPSKGPESGRPKLPQPVKVGHPGRANKAVPAGWIRTYRECAFRNGMKGGEHGKARRQGCS